MPALGGCTCRTCEARQFHHHQAPYDSTLCVNRLKETKAAPEIEPGTSRNLTKKHTTRPGSQMLFLYLTMNSLNPFRTIGSNAIALRAFACPPTGAVAQGTCAPAGVS